jgi:hypothetical protein
MCEKNMTNVFTLVVKPKDSLHNPSSTPNYAVFGIDDVLVHRRFKLIIHYSRLPHVVILRWIWWE